MERGQEMLTRGKSTIDIVTEVMSAPGSIVRVSCLAVLLQGDGYHMSNVLDNLDFGRCIVYMCICMCTRM